MVCCEHGSQTASACSHFSEQPVPQVRELEKKVLPKQRLAVYNDLLTES